MKGALDIHRELLARDVVHEIHRLPRMIGDAGELPRALALPPDRCVQVHVFEVDGRLAAALAPAAARPEPGRVLDALRGRTLRPALAQAINAATDYAAGLVAPLLLPSALPLLADLALCGAGVVYCPTGDTGTVLGIGADDLLRISGARVVDLLAAAVPAVDLTERRDAAARRSAARQPVTSAS